MSTFSFGAEYRIMWGNKGGIAMQTTDLLMEYIENSPSPYHAVHSAAVLLELDAAPGQPPRASLTGGEE